MKSEHLFYYEEWASTYRVWFCGEMKFTINVTYVHHCDDMWWPCIETWGVKLQGPELEVNLGLP